MAISFASMLLMPVSGRQILTGFHVLNAWFLFQTVTVICAVCVATPP